MGNRPPARLACPELVGRDDELASIGQLVETATSGASITLLVAGEAGLGKSALLSRAADIARRSGMRVLRGQGERIEMPRAFGPFVDALATLKDPGAAVKGVLSKGSTPSALHASMDERYQAHAAFARAIAEVTAERPLMVAIDDLHWADDSSLELFAYLARRVPGRLMLVGAYRTEELPRRAALRRLLRDIPPERLHEHALHPLTASDMTRALKLILGSGLRVGREVRELLQARCRGNPLFLEEMLRALARRGQLTFREGAWQMGQINNIPLPSSVAEALNERFQVLDPEQRQAIVLAAIIGERFDFDLLRSASGQDESKLMSAMRAAVASQIVMEDDRRPADAFVFRHALIRDAILEAPLAREKRMLHRSVADALLRGGDGDPAEVAYHYEEAGVRESAYTHWRLAGDKERARGAHNEAFSHYVRARSLAPDDDRTLADLSMLIARTAGGLGRRARVVEAIRDAATRYARLGDARAEAQALLHLRLHAHRHWAWPQSVATDAAERVAQLVGGLGDTPELCWLYVFDAHLAREARQYERALALATEAVAIGERCGAGWELGTAYGAMSLVHGAMGDMPTALTWYRKTVAFTSSDPEYGRQQMESATTRELLWLLRHAEGETDETLALARRAQQLRESYPGDQDVLRIHESLYIPDWDEFIRRHDEWSADEPPETLLFGHMGLHRATVEAARHGPAAIEAARALSVRMSALSTSRNLTAMDAAEAGLIAGDHAFVLEVLERAADHIERPHFMHDDWAAAVIIALLAANEAGDERAAELWLRRADWPEFTPPVSWSIDVGMSRRFVKAEHHWRDDRPDLAIGLMADFFDVYPVVPRNNPIFSNHVRLRYTEMAALRGSSADRARATETLGEIVSFYRKARATWYLERLRERADLLGLRFPIEEREATARVGLTRRELEVAGLVARGLTNKEIAERLTLSVRTAESHVEQIRTKLGFRTRSQIAAWVADRSVTAN